MEKFVYECDECEDIEMLDEKLDYAWACECGGSMHLQKADHFQEREYFDKCMICYNATSDKCPHCRYS